MYKTANTIRMLQILYSGGVVKKRDLAQELETNERNIREYKKELIMAGYDILEHKGRNGGLQLDSASIIPAARLNREQTDAFLEARDLVHTHSSFASMKEFDQAVEKLFSSVVPSPEEDDAILYEPQAAGPETDQYAAHGSMPAGNPGEKAAEASVPTP